MTPCRIAYATACALLFRWSLAQTCSTSTTTRAELGSLAIHRCGSSRSMQAAPAFNSGVDETTATVSTRTRDILGTPTLASRQNSAGGPDGVRVRGARLA